MSLPPGVARAAVGLSVGLRGSGPGPRGFGPGPPGRVSRSWVSQSRHTPADVAKTTLAASLPSVMKDPKPAAVPPMSAKAAKQLIALQSLIKAYKTHTATADRLAWTDIRDDQAWRRRPSDESGRTGRVKHRERDERNWSVTDHNRKRRATHDLKNRAEAALMKSVVPRKGAGRQMSTAQRVMQMVFGIGPKAAQGTAKGPAAGPGK